MEKFMLTVKYFFQQKIKEIRWEISRGYFSTPVFLSLLLIGVFMIFGIGWVVMIFRPISGDVSILLIWFVCFMYGAIAVFVCLLIYMSYLGLKEISIWLYDNWNEASERAKRDLNNRESKDGK